MNTTEIKTKGLIRSFEDLFKYARKQFYAYEKLEGIEDWEEHDFSIDCSADQMRFKDMLQIRCIEELTEATHALDNEEHFYEEISDSLNFFLSAYVMLGDDLESRVSPEILLGVPGDPFPWEQRRAWWLEGGRLFAWLYEVVDAIGDLCNLLKNRPWAQSNYLVSMSDFDKRLATLWRVFWGLLREIGLSKEKIFDMFERKYLVNLWRIKTGY